MAEEHSDRKGGTIRRPFLKGSRLGWLFVFGVILAVACWVLKSNAPWYKGRSASHWFKVYASMDKSEREEAILAFRAMGSDAVPMLVAQLEARPSRFGSVMNSLLNRIRKYSLDYNQQHNWRRERACDLLREMGESARDAIPALENASTDSMWYIATSARAALIKLRNEPLAPYISLLNDRSNPTRWYSNAMMIADCGTNAAAAIPLLLDSLRDTDTAQESRGLRPVGSVKIIQAHAIIAMGMIRCEPQVCVPAVIPFLTNGNVALRQKAYFALLAFKDHTQSVSNEVTLGLNDSDPWTRGQALLAVEEILSLAEKRAVLPRVETLLNDPDPFVRDSAKKLLPKIHASAAK